MAQDNYGLSDFIKSNIRRKGASKSELKCTGWVTVVCKDQHGNIRWVDEGSNIVVDEGIDYIFNNDLAAASNFVGLLGAGTPAAGWTMTQAGGSTGAPSDVDGDREVHAEYSEATRPAWTVVDSTAQSVTNTASVASFSITGSITITGAFLTTVSTKNNQTGTLIAAKLFAASRSVENGDTLEVTYAINGSSS